ncbi:hypothetical protein SLE2022_063390 [Rubroshorea leprosula]
MEEDAATPYTGNGIENEVASHHAEVARHSAKAEGNEKKKVETFEGVSTDNEVVKESEDMEEIRMEILDSNSNFQRLAETRKIVADPDMVNNKAEQGMFENGSQSSTNADMGSHGKSYQKSRNKTVEHRRSCREAEKYTKEIRIGLPTKDMGPEVDIGLRDPQPTNLQGPMNTGPEEQNEKTNNTTNRKSISSFWDDLESDTDRDANWMSRIDGCGKRKKKRRAKSCASVYRKSGGLEGFLVQQKLKGQKRAAAKTKKKVLFEKDVEKPVADDSINDSNIQNCNKNIEVNSRKRNMEALWSRVKEFGVTAQGEETSVI